MSECTSRAIRMICLLCASTLGHAGCMQEIEVGRILDFNVAHDQWTEEENGFSQRLSIDESDGTRSYAEMLQIAHQDGGEITSVWLELALATITEESATEGHLEVRAWADDDRVTLCGQAVPASSIGTQVEIDLFPSAAALEEVSPAFEEGKFDLEFRWTTSETRAPDVAMRLDFHVEAERVGLP